MKISGEYETSFVVAKEGDNFSGFYFYSRSYRKTFEHISRYEDYMNLVKPKKSGLSASASLSRQLGCDIVPALDGDTVTVFIYEEC